jgi:hypothetical protein
MTQPDYKEVLDGIFARVAEIIRQRSDYDAEIARLHQLMYAAANMLPDEERNAVISKWVEFFESQLNTETSLVDAVRKVLQEAGREWLTVAKVRDRLFSAGFDFSTYISNPLASVSTTLARLKKDEVQTTTIEGVTAYRWKGKRQPKLGLTYNKLRNLTARKTE